MKTQRLTTTNLMQYVRWAFGKNSEEEARQELEWMNHSFPHHQVDRLVSLSPEMGGGAVYLNSPSKEPSLEEVEMWQEEIHGWPMVCAQHYRVDPCNSPKVEKMICGYREDSFGGVLS